MPRGGARPGAGRKSNAEIKTCRQRLDKNITDRQWDDLFNPYTGRRAMETYAPPILLRYRYGDHNGQPLDDAPELKISGADYRSHEDEDEDEETLTD